MGVSVCHCVCMSLCLYVTVSVCQSRCLSPLRLAQRLRHYIEGGSGKQKGDLVVP